MDSVDDIQHELARESVRQTGMRSGVEIATMADVSAGGSGLGSSSSVAVGLLNAMYIYLGEPKALDFLARTACEIEIDRLKKRIGKKDRYIAAYGGFREVLFERGSNRALPCWGDKVVRHLQ